MNDMETTDENAPFTYLGHTFGFSIADVRAVDYVIAKEKLPPNVANSANFAVSNCIYRAYEHHYPRKPDHPDDEIPEWELMFFYNSKEKLVHEDAEKGVALAQEIALRFGVMYYMGVEVAEKLFIPSCRTRGDESLALLESFVNIQRDVMKPYAVEILRDVIDYADTRESKIKKADSPEYSVTDAFSLQTTQEADALFRAQADGRRAHPVLGGIMSTYRWDENNTALIHSSLPRSGKKPTHSVRIAVPSSEGLADDEEGSKTFLITLANAQSADAIFATSYVCEILLKQPTLQSWIDLDDVAQKIGYYPDKFNAADRHELRYQIWQYIHFCVCAEVHGTRSTTYYDRATGETIPSRISESLFAIHGRHFADLDLFPNRIPAQVKLGLNNTFAALLRTQTMRQYIGGLDSLAKIPSGKPGTAWARSVGVALLHQWRIDARQAKAGKVKITREELLTRYAPRTQTVQDVLSSDDPGRARKYWRSAMEGLREAGMIALDSPELQPGSEHLGADGKHVARQGWATSWIETEVLLLPSDAMKVQLEELTNNQYVAAPRDLSIPKGKKKASRKVVA